MKKILSVLLASVMFAGVVAGCGPTPTTAPTPAPASNDVTAPTDAPQVVAPTEAPPVAAGPTKVGFAQIGQESDWRNGCTVSVQQSCADAGFDLNFVDGQNKQENQIKALRDFITQGVEYIGFSPVVESGWDQVIQEINDANIPIIMLDRNTDIPGTDHYATWIGSNFIEEGQKAADWLIKFMEAEGRGNDEINIVELQGTVGSSPAIDRQKGFAEGIAGKSNFKITKSQTGDFTTDLGKTVMESFLKSGDKIDVVYAHNDGMALGAIQAIKEAGLQPGKDVIIIGVDAVKLAFEAIIDGEMNCTVECSPLLGPQFVGAINDLKAGKTLDKVTYSIEYMYDDYFSKTDESYCKSVVKELPNRVY